jgi:predicted MFS family arabinose efflux permease
MAVSLMGTYMQNVAQAWLVYDLSNSAFTLGMVGFIAMVPLVPWSLVAGVLADRMSRKKLLAIAYAGQIFPPLVMAALAWTGAIQVWHVVVFQVVLGALAVLGTAVRQGLILDVVGPEDFDSAAALSASVINIAHIVGSIVGGILVSLVGVAGAYALNGLSFAVVLIAFLAMRFQESPRQRRRASMGASLVEGVRYMIEDRTILAAFLVMALLSFTVLPYQTLLPVFARDVFHTGATGLGILNAVAGAGSIMGALAVASSRIRTQAQRGLLMLATTLGAAVFMAGFAFSQDFVLACALLAVASGAGVATKTVGFTLVQLQARDELRGRVTSIEMLMSAAAPKAGGLVMGLVASLTSAPVSLGLGALSCLVGGLVALGLWAPSLRRAVRQDARPETI